MALTSWMVPAMLVARRYVAAMLTKNSCQKTPISQADSVGTALVAIAVLRRCMHLPSPLPGGQLRGSFRPTGPADATRMACIVCKPGDRMTVCWTQVDGLPQELDGYLRRNHCLGNAVVPCQGKYCFSVLSGLLPYTGPSVAAAKIRRARRRPRAADTAAGAAAAATKRHRTAEGSDGEAAADEDAGDGGSVAASA